MMRFSIRSLMVVVAVVALAFGTGAAVYESVARRNFAAWPAVVVVGMLDVLAIEAILLLWRRPPSS